MRVVNESSCKEDVLAYIWTNCPSQILNSKLMTYLDRRFIPLEPRRQITEFLPKWRKLPGSTIEDMKEHVLFVTGPTAIGKTELILALFPTYGFFNFKEQLLTMNMDFPGIIFDDGNGSRWTDDEFLNFCDINHTR